MKNRRLVIVAFLLIATLTIGIGYAALSDTLTIIGNAHININQAQTNYDTKVYFSDAQIIEEIGSTASASVDEVGHGSDDATFTANTLATKGDYVTFKFTVKNDSNVEVAIQVNPTKLSGAENPSNSNTGIFKVEYGYGSKNGTTMTIASGGQLDVYVTVSVDSPVTKETSATFGIELTVVTTHDA